MHLAARKRTLAAWHHDSVTTDMLVLVKTQCDPFNAKGWQTHLWNTGQTARVEVDVLEGLQAAELLWKC